MEMTLDYEQFVAKYIIPLCLLFPNQMHTLKTKQLYSYLGNSNMIIQNRKRFKVLVEEYIDKVLLLIDSMIVSNSHENRKKSENEKSKMDLETILLRKLEKEIADLFQIQNPIEYFLHKKTHSRSPFESDIFCSNQLESIHNPLNNLLEIPSEDFENCSISTNSMTLINDPNSNYNLYSRLPMHKHKKERRKSSFKKENPLLKDFDPKFLKKENIDKKILRRFRAYIKEIILKKPCLCVNYDLQFWNDFSEIKLLPPMKYTELSNEIREFKSFNTKYYRWLFSKNGAFELFSAFARELGDDFLNSLIESKNQRTKEKEERIINKLKSYLFQIPELYSELKSKTCICTEELNSTCSVERKESENDLNEKEEKCHEYHNVFNIDLIPYNKVCPKLSEQENYFEYQENQSVNYHAQEECNDDFMWMIDQIKNNNTEYISHSNCC